MQAVVRLWLVYVYVLTLLAPPLAIIANTEIVENWIGSATLQTTCLHPRESAEDDTEQARDATARVAEEAAPVLDNFWRGAFHYMVRHNHPGHVAAAYLSALYAVVVFALAYRHLLKERIRDYDRRVVEPPSERTLQAIWLGSIAGLMVCGWILLQANAYSHPFANALVLDWRDLNEVRVRVARQSVPGLYSLGVNLFACTALLIAIGYLKRWWITAATVVAVAWFATFQLSKSSLSYVVIEVVVIGLVLRLFSVRAAVIGLGVAAGAAAAAIVLTLKSETLASSFVAFAYRLFLGEFADLPHYFCVFETQSVPLAAALPAWLKSMAGIAADPAGRVVMLATIPAQNVGVAGVANTFLTGEAYALFGISGVLIAPLLVFANLLLVVHVFLRLPRTLLNGIVLGYFMFKLIVGVNSGISVYLFSSIHVMLALYVGAVVAVHWLRKALSGHELFPARR